MNPILKTNALTKRFGKILAVDNLEFDVQEGQVYGILGPNGSGKTTTLGMILGVTKKTKGSFSWFGDGESHKLRKSIGAILEHPIFYPFLNALENLRITALIKDLDNPPYEDVLKLVGLYARRKDPFRTYSLGMKQRLAIAASFLADPRVLIFDEPTNGLDPQGIADIRNLILKIHKMGKTIILASHLLDEVQKVCSDFMVLDRGKKIYSGSVESALNHKNKIELAAQDMEKLFKALQEYRPALSLIEQNGSLLIESGKEISTTDVNRYLIERGITLSHLLKVKGNLEEQFLAILNESDGEVAES
jgi:ABC-2 type transport system ATP-binding protein